MSSVPRGVALIATLILAIAFVTTSLPEGDYSDKEGTGGDTWREMQKEADATYQYTNQMLDTESNSEFEAARPFQARCKTRSNSPNFVKGREAAGLPKLGFFDRKPTECLKRRGEDCVDDDCYWSDPSVNGRRRGLSY